MLPNTLAHHRQHMLPGQAHLPAGCRARLLPTTPSRMPATHYCATFDSNVSVKLSSSVDPSGSCGAGGRRMPSGSRFPVVCHAEPALRSAAAGQVDPVYLAGANYLKSIGFTNTAEIARVLDIAMNPNSLFMQYSDTKRSQNSLARPLSVEEDMQPVVDFLRSRNLANQQVVQVISAHPPVLCYSVPERLQPFWDYLASIGVESVAEAVVQRPSLLGLDVDNNLRKIVEYLQYVETPPDKIVAYITKSI